MKFKLNDLKIGMYLDGYYGEFNYVEWVRVEAVAHDWAVVRDEDDNIYLLDEDSDMEKYEEKDSSDSQS